MNFEFEIENFLSNFLIAIKNISSDCYRIPTTYNKFGIHRERIFCNELSIQFRYVFGEDFPLRFHPEINKSGHPDFNGELRGIDPDFILHSPGTNDNNLVVFEVKGTIRNRRNILRDITKLFFLIENTTVHYQYGIFLLYNHSLHELKTTISDLLGEVNDKYDEKIFIICSSASGQIEQCDLRFLR